MKNKKYYLLAFIIPLVMMILLYLSVGVIGGNKNVLTVDMAGQYIAFFNSLKYIFNGLASPFFSFSKTLGGNMLGIITYYLMSPLNLIVLLFDRIDVPKAILIINILKIGLSGFTSYIYFNKTFKSNNFTSLIFSIIYSMMSYNIVYSQNIMWLDGVILLPIVFLGIDKLIEKKPLLFYISLTLTIITNYYIGYMICIGSLIYFIYKDYLKEEKIVKENIINFIKYLLLSVLTSSIILIPSILSLLSGKASNVLPEFIPEQKFPLFDLITRLFIGAFKNSDLEGGCPNIYISLLSILLSIHYFFNSKISKKEKKATLILVSVFIISFIFYPIDVIWHTFKHPYGFPFRYSFIFDFILLIIAFKDLINLKIDKKFVKKFIIYSFIITLVVDKLLYNNFMFYKVFGSFVLLMIYLYYLIKKKKLNSLILVLVILEMFLNSFLIVINIKYQNKDLYNEFINTTGFIVDKLNEKENFYRLEKDYSYSTNDELLLNYNGISHFSSVYEEDNNKLLGKYLGIFNRFYITNYYGSTLVTNSLFNIKYLLSKKDLNYYELLSRYEDVHTYLNKYNLPIGFTVNNNILNLELEEYEPFINQNNILKAMNNNIEDVFIKENAKVTLNNLELDKNSKTLLYKKINYNDSASLIFEVEQLTNGILYGYFPSKTNKKVDILLNGESIIDITDQNSFHYNIVELGNHKNKKQKIEIRLLEDSINLNDYMFYTLDLDKFDNAIKLLRQNDELKILEYKNDYIKANINVNNNSTLYTSIPYNNNFKILIDNKEVKGEKLFNALLALNLDKGNHEIVIKYIPKDLYCGTILSIIGIISFAIIYKKDKKYSKRS